MRRIAALIVASIAVSVSPSLAADMPVKAPRMAKPVWSWAGLYIGGHGGYAFGRVGYDVNNTGLGVPFGTTLSPEGFMGGGQIGYNVQSGNAVYGVEVSYSAGKLHDMATVIDPSAVARDLHATYRGLLMASARLGWAVDRNLLYVRGGYAGTSLQLDWDRNAAFGFVAQGTSKSWAHGFNLGAGWEYMLTQNWIAGVEYNFAKFYPGNQNNVELPGTLATNFENINAHLHTVTGRISYKF